jgi:hypothetical protein
MTPDGSDRRKMKKIIIIVLVGITIMILEGGPRLKTEILIVKKMLYFVKWQYLFC